MTTSSDEQHRIQKMIKGSNGVTDQNAADEQYDNGLDEGSTHLKSIFNGGKLSSIYNNGKPMDCEDRKNCLTLDTRAKSNNLSKVIKGQYGVGGAFARAKLGGQGIERITTKDGNVSFQCDINLKNLCDTDISPSQCWTGEHVNRPTWIQLQNSNEYENGVTKEYIGDDLHQNFDLSLVVEHLAVKYNSYIKKGVVFEIIWDNNTYIVPDIYSSSEEDIDKKIINLDMYDNDETWFKYNTDMYKCCKNRNGVFVCPNRKMKSRENSVLGKHFDSVSAQPTVRPPSFPAHHENRINFSKSEFHFGIILS